jgi:hypothetical protein
MRTTASSPDLDYGDGVPEVGLAATEVEREALLQIAEALSWRKMSRAVNFTQIKVEMSAAWKARYLPLEGAAIDEDRWDQASAFRQTLMSPRSCINQTQTLKPR